MPRSSTTSPTIPEPDISNSFVPGLTLTHSPDHHHQSSTNNSTTPVRKKHKYMKPRIGSSFQAKIEPFDEKIAKATIKNREKERKTGISGYRNSNGLSSVGEEYGMNGGLFAAATSPSSLSNNGGYGYGSNGSGGWNGSNGGRRKRAGRPPKSGKGSRGKAKLQKATIVVVFFFPSFCCCRRGSYELHETNKNLFYYSRCFFVSSNHFRILNFDFTYCIITASSLFQNNQPIYYDPVIRPPCGGLCIHRPMPNYNNDNDFKQEQQETKNEKSSTAHHQQQQQQQQQLKHDQFLTFARNIMLQTPTNKQENQSIGQYSINTSKTHQYQRINYLYNDIVKNGLGDDGALYTNGGKKRNSNSNGADGRRSKKRKVGDLTTKTNNNTSDSSLQIQIDTTNGEVCMLPSSTNENIIRENDNTSEEEKVVDSSNCSKIQSVSSKEVALGLEDDEQYLEYLHRNHNGNVERAQFYLLSDLCRGGGEKEQWNLQKERNEI